MGGSVCCFTLFRPFRLGTYWKNPWWRHSSASSWIKFNFKQVYQADLPLDFNAILRWPHRIERCSSRMGIYKYSNKRTFSRATTLDRSADSLSRNLHWVRWCFRRHLVPSDILRYWILSDWTLQWWRRWSDVFLSSSPLFYSPAFQEEGFSCKALEYGICVELFLEPWPVKMEAVTPAILWCTPTSRVLATGWMELHFKSTKSNDKWRKTFISAYYYHFEIKIL